MADVEMHLPIAVGDYTDFYSSREHATNVGIMFRGKDNALQPNWLHMPIGYNGRASTVVVSGTAGAPAARADEAAERRAAELRPVQAARLRARNGRGRRQPSAIGHMLSEQQAEQMIFGLVLLNDWSARDIQAWEYVPLGPFLAKNFATSISPWIVTLEALEPFRTPGRRRTRRRCPTCRQAQATITIFISKWPCERRP